MKKWLVMLCLLITQPCLAANSTQAGDFTTKNVWMHLVQLKLPEEFCKEGSEYTTCFSLTQEECLAMTRWFTSVCLANMENQLPDKLTTADGKKWGAAAGHCVNELYQKFLAGKRVEGQNCPPMPNIDKPAEGIPDPTRPNNEQ